MADENTVILTEDDEDPVLDGDISEFMAANAVPAKKYGVMLKRRREGAAIQNIESYRNRIPTLEEIGKQFGPGVYILVFTWTVKGAPGGKGTRAENYEMELPEDPWRRRYVKYQRELLDIQEKEDKERLKAKKEEATLEGLQKNAGGGGSSIEELKAMAETLRAIGVPIGGNVGGGLTLEKIVGYVTLLSPILTPIFQNIFAKDNSAKEMNALLLQMLINKNQSPENDKMKGLIDTLFTTTQRALALSGPAEPKEDIVDKIFGLIETVGPTMLQAIAAKTPEQRKKDPIFNAAAGSAEMKAVKEDPELLEALVNRLDQEYGYQGTDVILKPMEDIGIRRPESTFGNKAKYPSKGFDAEGNKLTSNE